MKSRIDNSIKNITYSLIGQSFGLIISFFSRIFFVRILGTELLGLNGLFTNVLTILSLAELGVGEAITFCLYKPLADNDIEKCKMYMQAYKKIYMFIGTIIALLGLLITPLIPILFKEVASFSNVRLIFFLFVINTAISYFYSYKKNLLIADQKKYIVVIYRYFFFFILNIFQMAFLYFTKNYIIYLCLQIIFTLLENILISKKSNKLYSYLQSKDRVKLDKNGKEKIITNTKALMLHKIGGTIVSSTDSIVLSKFVSIISVGIYSNYLLIINALNTILGQLFLSTMSSVGNLIATSKKEKVFDIFKKSMFANFMVYGITSILLACLVNPFISIWLGDNYLFSLKIVVVLVVNYYISGMRKSVLIFKEAAGLFIQDKWKPLVEALVNIIFSIVFVKRYGVIGIFYGTIISSLMVCFWIEPLVLFKHCFETNVGIYFKTYIKYFLTFVLMISISIIICNKIHFDNIYINFIALVIVSCIIPLLIFYCLYSKTCEYKYFKDIVIKTIKKKKTLIMKRK